MSNGMGRDFVRMVQNDHSILPDFCRAKPGLSFAVGAHHGTDPVAAGLWPAVELGILPGGQSGSTQKSLKTGLRAHRFLADERSVPRLTGCQPVETADCQSERGGVARTAGPLCRRLPTGRPLACRKLKCDRQPVVSEEILELFVAAGSFGLAARLAQR